MKMSLCSHELITEMLKMTYRRLQRTGSYIYTQKQTRQQQRNEPIYRLIHLIRLTHSLISKSNSSQLDRVLMTFSKTFFNYNVWFFSPRTMFAFNYIYLQQGNISLIPSYSLFSQKFLIKTALFVFLITEWRTE